MHIILTHEQADFDALASLLGAHLLQDGTLAVLPSRLNRNVRAFVTLYGVELPFIERQDLPQEALERITLVDTQSMVTVKGMSARTQVTVIDHHPVRADVPENWQVVIGDTGANTTLFVEGLQDHSGPLRPLHATLLLMGIYEDTGSLTYSRTTPRDIRAAAFLLENGANLKLAVDFLNHPLSLPQQALYDELRANAEPLSVHGHSVILSSGDASQMDEELSTVAHKLRDLMDPDALILLIKTRGGVQLIARSTTDNIDVSELAGAFGGGGHSRAAAALVKAEHVQDVLPTVKETLTRVIRPAVTVAQIMSRGPQVLSPETTVDEAARRMQRFGYEGYPIVQNGKVIGLLTRRAVDRALAHKLNLKAASLMDAGEVTVTPDESIGKLQRIMTESGWGQVPVVSPEDGRIIGIVTRTDLLKILTGETSGGPVNLAGKLESALPAARLSLLKIAAAEAPDRHCALYIVGGFVRDLILNRPGQDFDLVVEGDAIGLAKALAHKYGGRVTSHSRFGTAKWYVRGKFGGEMRLPFAGQEDLPEFLDLISARTEFYTHPTALPTVERGSIKLDLHRRDFTINTLALRLDGYHYGELHDYWGGMNDLRQGWVRSLHSLSFVEDPTRMLRAVRFEQRFGFEIEPRTCHLLSEALPLISRVSGDRIRHELDHILDEPRATQMIARLDELLLLQAIHPALHWDEWFHGRLDELKDAVPGPEWTLVSSPEEFNEARWNNIPLRRALAYILWVIRLPEQEAVSAFDRLKVPRDLVTQMRLAGRALAELGSLVGMKPSRLTERLDEISPLALYAVWLAASGAGEREMLAAYMQKYRACVPTINGDDLRRMGLPPGPSYKEILSSLRAAWLDGEVQSVEQEKELLAQLIKSI